MMPDFRVFGSLTLDRSIISFHSKESELETGVTTLDRRTENKSAAQQHARCTLSTLQGMRRCQPPIEGSDAQARCGLARTVGPSKKENTDRSAVAIDG